MSEPNRRRGAQPGNQNALKNGLYRGKNQSRLRPPGGQPYNLNSLKHGRYSRILHPAPPGSAYPSEIQLPLEQSTLTLLRVSYDAALAQIEKKCLDLLDDPYCSPAELVLRLRQLNTQIDQLLSSLPVATSTSLVFPERKKPQ